jgi:hypothetical protein
MYPTIRPGDVLRIQSTPVADIRVGDIAVCRRPKHLFSHRVMAKGAAAGRPYVITRPDRVLKDDGPTFDENLLGVVVAIERRGRSVPLRPAKLNRMQKYYFSSILTLMETRMRVRLWWFGITARLLETSLYRRLVWLWFRLARPRLSYSVRVPMPALGDAVFRQMAPEDFNVERDWRNRPVRRWTLTLHLNGAAEPAAWVTLVRDEADQWRAEETYVTARYHGGGLKARLISRAHELLQPGNHRPQPGEPV